MDPTTLNLLTRDGVVKVLISPALEGDQYAELHQAVWHAATADELRAAVKKVCDRLGREVHFE